MIEHFNCNRSCCCYSVKKYNPSRKEYHVSNKVKSGMFIYDPSSEKVLLVQSRGNLWGIPKGSLIDGETYDQCAVREVREETGLCIPSDKFEMFTRVYTAMYYYVEYPEKEMCIETIHKQDGMNGVNDMNGIGWFHIECIKELSDMGILSLNKHTKIVIQRFKNIFI